jgi:hypothetical protein
MIQRGNQGFLFRNKYLTHALFRVHKFLLYLNDVFHFSYYCNIIIVIYVQGNDSDLYLKTNNTELKMQRVVNFCLNLTTHPFF